MDILIREIIEYLTEEISPERKARYKLVRWFKAEPDRELKSELELNILKKKERIDHYWEKITELKEAINELKQIKTSYQKAYVFFKNMQKGCKKGFNYRSNEYGIKYSLNHNNRDKAIKEAKEHLEYVKKWRSERTYYREKKKLRELGIIL